MELILNQVLYFFDWIVESIEVIIYCKVLKTIDFLFYNSSKIIDTSMAN